MVLGYTLGRILSSNPTLSRKCSINLCIIHIEVDCIDKPRLCKIKMFNLKPVSSPLASSTHISTPSPTATEIAYDISDIEHDLQLPEERIESLQAAGIKVRDFASETLPKLSKAPEVFDAVRCLIATDWHMRNPQKNYSLLSPKGLFRLIKMGWLTLSDASLNLNPHVYAALMEYNNRPDEQQYPFVVLSSNEPKPTPSQRVRLRRKEAGFYTYLDDVPDSKFFGYNPTGLSDEEEEVEDIEVVEEPMPKRRKVEEGYC
jgi:hypothetical protein